MSLNDNLALIVSILALIASIVAIVVGQFQQNRVMRTTMRDQMTTIVLSLIEATHEYMRQEADFYNAPQRDERESLAHESIISALSHKLTSLARQACELKRSDSDLCFDAELIAIGDALEISGDLPLAEELFMEAIQRAPSDYYRAMNLRLAALFCFRTNSQVKGRKLFEQSVGTLPNEGDLNCIFNSRSYQLWIETEQGSDVPDQDTLSKLYAAAETILSRISNSASKRDIGETLQRLGAKRSEYLIGGTGFVR